MVAAKSFLHSQVRHVRIVAAKCIVCSWLQTAAAEQQMMRWEGYNADGSTAVRWHEMNHDAAKADNFGVAERGNAVLRPQMTALRATRQTGGDLLAGLNGAAGCAIITGTTNKY